MRSRWFVVAVAALPLLAASGCKARPIAEGRTATECTGCHGSDANAAPPNSVTGSPATTEVGVGAHQLHLRATEVRGAIACGECHPVPATINAPGHLDGRHATVTFGSVATGNDAVAPSWYREEARCSVWCHGAALGGGSATAPLWTYAAEPDPGRPGICATCHGDPPPAPHTRFTACHACHPETVKADGSIDTDGGHHIDGKVDRPDGFSCDRCHGAPPDTGAHARHATRPPDAVAYGDLRTLEEVDPDGGATDYSFGCGSCHPLDPSLHGDGTVQVELSPDVAPAGTLRARNRADAAWDAATRTCSGVACHSSGQETPAYVEAPDWTGGPIPAGCFGCHGNPPAYWNGGPGAPDANAHLAAANLDYPYAASWGHGVVSHAFQHGGVPGEYIGQPERHASPPSCQACHFETVDPSNTAPGGFIYLDTSVDTLPPTDGDWPALRHQCQGCHTGADGAPAAANGRVLPLRHVNGKRDVDFDPRTEVPDGYYAGFLAFGREIPAPSRPYFILYAFYHFRPEVVAALPVTPETVVTPGPLWGAPTVSFPLTEARYDPVTKSCTTIACHFKDSPVTNWGGPWVNSRPDGCNTCH